MYFNTRTHYCPWTSAGRRSKGRRARTGPERDSGISRETRSCRSSRGLRSQRTRGLRAHGESSSCVDKKVTSAPSHERGRRYVHSEHRVRVACAANRATVMTVALLVFQHLARHFRTWIRSYFSEDSRHAASQPGLKARYVKSTDFGDRHSGHATALTLRLRMFIRSVARGSPVRIHDRHGRHTHDHPHPLPAPEPDGHAAVRLSTIRTVRCMLTLAPSARIRC